MPPARRSTGTRSTSGPGRQSTLSFGHRVTKNVSKASKDSAISPSVAKQALSQKKEQGQTVPGEDAEGDDVKHDVAQDVSIEPEELQPEEELKPVPEKSEFEVKAEKISNAAVQRYWRSIESQRMAEQVHQEGVATAEKVLRYFDVSSQYGVSHHSSSSFLEFFALLAVRGSLGLILPSSPPRLALHWHRADEEVATGTEIGLESPN